MPVGMENRLDRCFCFAFKVIEHFFVMKNAFYLCLNLEGNNNKEIIKVDNNIL